MPDFKLDQGFFKEEKVRLASIPFWGGTRNLGDCLSYAALQNRNAPDSPALPIYAKHSVKFPNVLGGHLISMNIPHKK